MKDGSFIRELRRAAGMSQTELAGKLDVSYQQVQKYERGASELSVSRLIQIAKAFNVPAYDLIEESKGAEFARMRAAFSNLSEDEERLLFLFRKIKRKELKEGFIDMLKEIVKLSEKGLPEERG